MVELIKQDFFKNQSKYKKIEEDLKNILGEKTKINHVGSTAIPDMVGKNIIDILISAVDKSEFLKFSKILEGKGYFKSERSATDNYNFFASKKEETKSGDVHIHLSIVNTDRHDEFLLLKEYLLKNPKVAKEYAKHKQEILNKFGLDRARYRQIKSEYVENLILKSKKESR